MAVSGTFGFSAAGPQKEITAIIHYSLSLYLLLPLLPLSNLLVKPRYPLQEILPQRLPPIVLAGHFL